MVTEILFDNCFNATIGTNLAVISPSNPLEPQRLTTITSQPQNNKACNPYFREEQLPNGIKVYGMPSKIQVLSQLVSKYPTLWKDKGFVDISVND